MRFAPQEPMTRYSANREFYPNRDRVLETLVYLMTRHPGITQYQIVKSVFFGDRKHLNEVGRPVTFDNYVAMKKGPVPSLILDLLKPGANFFSIFKADPPWGTKTRGRAHEFRATRGVRQGVLSRTDLEALDYGLKMVLARTEDELEVLLHNDPGYKEAWKKRRNDDSSVAIPAGDLLDDKDEALIANLVYATRA